MPRAGQATIDLLSDYFQEMEVKDFDRLGAYYADDITQTFANAPTITGRDDTEVKINACSIFTIADGQFTDQRS